MTTETSSSVVSSWTSCGYRRVALPLPEDNMTAESHLQTIVTHSGTFQADEAMGVWMLRQLPNYRHAALLRTRDASLLASAPPETHLILDVGGIYNHEHKRYDHHQRDYDERFDDGKGYVVFLDTDELAASSTSSSLVKQPRCTKLSASGLIYRHYGKAVLQTYYPDLQEPALTTAYVKLYDTLLEALDAVDTGVEIVPAGVELLYQDVTGLAARVGRLNPRWNEDDGVGEDARFEQAVVACGEDFISIMTRIVESDIPAQALVEQAVQNRSDVDCASQQIIVLPSGGLPWRQYLYDAERKLRVNPPIKFVLYVDSSGMWRVQAVTVEGRGFTNRLSLPQFWWGLRDNDLVAVTGIPGARFVHANGFIGGNDTYKGAWQMAQAALSHTPQN